jgi:hypothetical protein
VGHGEAFAAGPSHGCAAGVGLDGSGGGEAGSIVADLGEYPGAGERSKSWQAGDDLGVRVLTEMVDGGASEVLGVGGGGVECSQQGQGLAAEGVLDEGQLVEVLGAQDRLDPGGFGVDAALATRAAQQRRKLGDGDGLAFL